MKKRGLTRVEKERVSKQEMGRLTEEIDVMGQESEVKAAPWVIEKGKEEATEEARKKDITLEKLTSSRKQIYTYREALLQEVNTIIKDCEIPEGYFLGARFTSKGLVFWVRDPHGTWYGKGMKISGDPIYDMNCVDRTIIKALDYMDGLVVEGKKTKGGIYLE